MKKFRERKWIRTIEKSIGYPEGELDEFYQDAIEMFPEKKEGERIYLNCDANYDGAYFSLCLERLETDEEYQLEKDKWTKKELNKLKSLEKRKQTLDEKKKARLEEIEEFQKSDEYKLYLELQKKFGK